MQGMLPAGMPPLGLYPPMLGPPLSMGPPLPMGPYPPMPGLLGMPPGPPSQPLSNGSPPPQRPRGRKSRGSSRNQDGQSQRSVLSTQMQKTKLCDFHKEGRCKYGASCVFAHSSEELKDMPDLRKTRICTAFTQGNCSNLDCNFAHGTEELRMSERSYRQQRSANGEHPGCAVSMAVPKMRLKRKLRQRPKKTKALGGGCDRSRSSSRDAGGSDGDRSTKRQSIGDNSIICNNCGSSMAVHLGYSVCSICRM